MQAIQNTEFSTLNGRTAMNKKIIMKIAALGLAAVLSFTSFACSQDRSEEGKAAETVSPPSEGKAAETFPPPKEGAALTPETPVAVVNGKPATKRVYDMILNREVSKLNSQTNGMHGSITPNEQIKAAAMQQLVDTELLYQESLKFQDEGNDEKIEEAFKNIRAEKSDEEFEAALKNDNLTVEALKDLIARKISIDYYVSTQIESSIEIPEEKVKEFYDNNPDNFKMLESVKASHICVAIPADEEGKKNEAKEKADNLLKKVRDGADFAELAKENSDCSTSAGGGDLGYFTRQMLPEPFTTPVFAMKVGEISEPIEVQNMYHIVKLEDRKEARTVSLEEEKDKIVVYLKKIETGKAVQEKIKQLREVAKIDYVAPHL